MNADAEQFRLEYERTNRAEIDFQAQQFGIVIDYAKEIADRGMLPKQDERNILRAIKRPKHNVSVHVADRLSEESFDQWPEEPETARDSLRYAMSTALQTTSVVFAVREKYSKENELTVGTSILTHHFLDTMAFGTAVNLNQFDREEVDEELASWAATLIAIFYRDEPGPSNLAQLGLTFLDKLQAHYGLVHQLSGNRQPIISP